MTDNPTTNVLIAITGAGAGNSEAAAKVIAAANHPLLSIARRRNKVRIGGRISANHVADMVLFTCQMPQKVLIPEMVITPTRQEY